MPTPLLETLRELSKELTESQKVTVNEEREVLSTLIYYLDNRLRLLESLTGHAPSE